MPGRVEIETERAHCARDEREREEMIGRDAGGYAIIT